MIAHLVVTVAGALIGCAAFELLKWAVRGIQRPDKVEALESRVSEVERRFKALANGKPFIPQPTPARRDAP